MYSTFLFIDSRVEHYQHFFSGIEQPIDITILNLEEDGIEQITKILSTRSDIQQIHILSHGAPGCLFLGSTQLSLTTLDYYQAEVGNWFIASTGSTPSLFLYGCTVAAGDAGEEFLNKLHRLTGANIAASTTLIGHAALGGNWDLDHTIGQILPHLPIALDVLETFPGVLASPPSITDAVTLTRLTPEETSLSVTGLSISDPDTGETQTVTLTVTQGTLALASTTGLTGVTGNGSGSITFSGAIASVNNALNGMTYTPALDYSGNETLTVTANDGTQSAAPQSVAIAITPVNDAPTIAPTAAVVAEGGNITFAASNFNIADVDNQQVQIIVKIDSLPTKGTLKLNGNRLVSGSTFSYDNIGLLVYEHDGTQTTASGGTADGFTVTVDDGAGGTIGVTTIPITVTPVNQLPSATGTVTLFEGEVDHPVSLSITDSDQAAATYNLEILSLPADGVLKFNGSAVTIGQTLTSADLANLTYSHNGNEGIDGFPPPTSFQVRVIDDGGGTGTPGSSTATVNLTIKPNNDDPTLVNNTGLNLNATGGMLTQVITAADLQVADVDSPTTQLTYTLTAVPDPTIGTLQLFNGTVWQKLGAGTTFTQDDLNDGRVRYEFHRNSTGGESFADSFQFQVRDGEIREYPTVREGGIWKPDGSTLETLTFNINTTVPVGSTGGSGGTQNPDVSDDTPPALDLNTGISTLSEGNSTLITNALLKANDADSSATELVYRIVELPTSGAIKLNGNSLGLYGSFTQDDIDNNRVTFEHAGNEDFIDRFKFTLSDGKNVTFEQTFVIDITPQNDAPGVTVNKVLSLAEGDTITVNSTIFSLGDVDGTGEKSGTGFATLNTLTFQIETLPTHGTLQVDQGSGFVNVTTSTVITQAQLDSNQLRYVHSGTENFSDSFSVRAYDDSGAVNSVSAPRTVNISIASLNDNPSPLTSLDLNVNEGGTGIIEGSNYSAGDPHLVYADPDNNTIQRQYRITTAVANGTLSRNGSALAVGSVFAQDDLDNNRISYKHNGSENYTDVFYFTVSDGGGTAVPGSYNITIDPANDAPQLVVPATQRFDTDTPFVFNAANNNRITVSDIDLATITAGETDILQVTLDLQGGGATYTASTLTLGSVAGVTVTSGTNGAAGGTLTFTGTQAAIQAALDGLQVQVPTDEDRALSLVVTVNDLNNGGADPVPPPPGYNTTVTKTIALNTSNDNDAPIISRPATVSVNEDTSLALISGNLISIADPDTFTSNTNTVTLSVTQGTIALADTSLITGGANNSTSITLTGSSTALNTALAGLSYRGNINFNGSDTLTIVANDQGNTGLNAGASDPKVDTQTVAITVIPVNDIPSLTAPSTTQVIANTNPLVFNTSNGNSITVDDLADLSNNGNDNFTVTLTTTSGGTPYGTLTVATGSGAIVTGDGTANVTINGTKTQVDAALNGLAYAPTDYNSETTVSLAVGLNDNANGGPGELTANKNITINISDVNNAPVINRPASVVASEDALFSFTGGDAIAIADPDDFGGNLQVTLSVAAGTLTLGSLTGLTVLSGSNGSNAITVRGTEADVNAALNTLQYQGGLHFNGSDALTILVDDLGNTGSSGAKTDTKIVAITVNPINDAPIRNGGNSVAFGAVNEDALLTGVAVTSLFASKFNDSLDQVTGGSSANAFAGIAVTANSAVAGIQGRWQWSNDGVTWNNISTGVTTSTALVLAENSLVRFLPNANYNGIAGSLSARLIDTSQGGVTSGTIANVNPGGGITQYSNSSNAVSLTTSVTAVNDAPIATGASSLAPINEDTTNPLGDTVANLFTARFNDSTDQVTGGSTAHSLAGVAVVGNAATATEGVWQYYNGTSWQDVGNRTASNALIVSSTHNLRFVPAANYNGAVPALTAHLIDSSSGAVATGNTVDLSGVGATGDITAYSSATVPLTSSVNPVNDAPAFTNLGGTVAFTENGTAVVLDDNAIVSDVDLDAINNWSGATLTLQRQGGASGQDAFENTGTLTALIQGSSVSVSGTAIATVTTNSNGTLTLTFNGNATPALVSSALQQIAYRNTSEDPAASVTIAYTLNDGNTGAQGSGGALAASGTVTVNITRLNDAPILAPGATLSYTENQPAQVVDSTVTLMDADDTQMIGATITISSGFTPGDILAATSLGAITATYDSATGVLTLSGTDSVATYQQVLRSLTYSSTSETPTATSPTRTLTWQVTDANSDGAGVQNSNPVTSTIFVNPTPDAVDDAFTTVEDTPLTGTIADSDVGNPSATYSVSVNPTHGTLTLNGDGTFSYTPADDYHGTDSFTYTVTDANGDTDTAIATLTSTPVVDVVSDSLTTNEDTPQSINVLTNDSFEPGRQVTAITQGTNGSVTFNPDGTVTYTPNDDYHGTDSFTYTITTAAGNTETATVNVTVNPVADAVNDTITTNEDTPQTINVLTNDNFEPGTQVTSITQGTNGSVTFNPDGTVTYTPNDDYLGTDSFTYSVTTASGTTETATVNVTVNPGVDTVDDTITTNEDTPQTINVLTNDNFEPGRQVTAITQGTNGSVTFNLDGTVTYTPHNDYHGTDSFTYTVTTAAGNTETATVNVIVNPIVDGVNDGLVTPQNLPRTINVLTNDSFEPGHQVTSVTPGTNGIVNFQPDGSVTYTPTENFVGTDSFTYTVTTAAGNTETATVNVTVNLDSDADTIADIDDLDDDNDGIVDTIEQNGDANRDTDNDGVLDYLDLDADSDGISDVVEAGHGAVDANHDGRVDGIPSDFGNNGLLNSLETSSDSGTPNYTPLNTDGDRVPDFQDLDSDNDGINDVVEANGTDIDGDGLLDGANLDVNNNGITDSVEQTPLPIPDTDGDGAVDYRDLDTDNDGVPDLEEAGLDPLVVDVDNDGVIDAADPDGDGIQTAVDGNTTQFGDRNGVSSNALPNADQDTIPDFRELDSDNDGTSDRNEAGLPVGVDTPDSNNDGRVDSPADGDRDGIADSIDIKLGIHGGFDSKDTDEDGITDTRDLDDDNDGILDTVEANGNPDRDTDGDGMSDSLDLDSDNDGILDLTEAGHGGIDSDRDGRVNGFFGSNGFANSLETTPDNGTPNYTPLNTDGDNVPDFQDLDSDNDAISDVIEAGGSDPDGDGIIGQGTPTDTDDDGIADGIDPSTGGTPLPIPDGDRDGQLNFRDLDSDNDGIFDLTEQNSALLDANRDGRVDGSDADQDGLIDVTDGDDVFFGSRNIPIPAPIDTNNNGIADFLEPPLISNGSQGADNVTGTNGDDILNGFSDIDILRGLAGNDIINGGSSSDTMRGDEGNDTLNGGSGNDDMEGGVDNDTLNGGSGNDRMLGGDGNDILNGGEDQDAILGNRGNDILNGGDGHDRLYGNEGNDIIRGNRGNDLIVGGFGADVLTGGQGRDRFVFTSKKDFKDRVTDFEIVKDRIDLKPIQGINSMGDLRFSQRGDDTLIQGNTGNKFQTIISLDDVNANTLTRRHFIF